jgi:hypothetical protein
MADRKQFHNVAVPDPDLLNLLVQSRERSVTDEDLREQRISFAFGNAPAASPLITKASVRLASENVRLLP